MKYNFQVFITEHACVRFIERFTVVPPDKDHEEQMRIAQDFIRDIWATARYVSDDPEGILFRNNAYKADMIIFNRRMKTIFVTNSLHKQHEQPLQPENL